MAQTLKVNEEFIAECKRNAMVREQARVLLKVIYQYKQNINLLRKKLNEYKQFVVDRLQPDAIELTLDFLERKKDQFLLELREEVRDILITARINGLEQNSDDGYVLKEDQAVFEAECLDPGKEVCELIGSYVANLLHKKNSPKCRVYKNHKDKVKVTLALGSEFKPAKNHPELVKSAQNFAEFFATSILIGDSDFMNHAGIRADQQGQHYWARINNEDALHYTKFINGIEQIKLDSKFLGLEFAYELNKTIDYLDEKRIRLAIKTALDNLKEIYKTNFLHNKQIIKIIQKRMNIEEELTEQLIEDAIIENMRSLRGQLKKMAEHEFIKALREAKFIKDDETINYKQFFSNAAKHDKTPIDLSLFMKHAIRSNDYKSVEYLNELNQELGYENIRIDNSTPLEFALKEEKNELALKMLKDGFILNYNEVNKSEKDKKNIELALENILARKLKNA